MIKPGEIQQKANAVGVRDQQIEKDYILSWILFGIVKHEQLSKAIVFKGGTVLKKVYFEDLLVFLSRMKRMNSLLESFHNIRLYMRIL